MSSGVSRTGLLVEPAAFYVPRFTPPPGDPALSWFLKRCAPVAMGLPDFVEVRDGEAASRFLSSAIFGSGRVASTRNSGFSSSARRSTRSRSASLLMLSHKSSRPAALPWAAVATRLTRYDRRRESSGQPI